LRTFLGARRPVTGGASPRVRAAAWARSRRTGARSGGDSAAAGRQGRERLAPARRHGSGYVRVRPPTQVPSPGWADSCGEKPRGSPMAMHTNREYPRRSSPSRPPAPRSQPAATGSGPFSSPVGRRSSGANCARSGSPSGRRPPLGAFDAGYPAVLDEHYRSLRDGCRISISRGRTRAEIGSTRERLLEHALLWLLSDWHSPADTRVPTRLTRRPPVNLNIFVAALACFDYLGEPDGDKQARTAAPAHGLDLPAPLGECSHRLLVFTWTRSVD